MAHNGLMTWARILLMLAAAAVVIAVVCLAVLLNLDYGRFKGTVETLVSKQMGRAFAIDGAFDISLSSTITVVADGIRLGNADWAEETNMLTVDRFFLALDTWSLLRGPVRIEAIELSGVDILLERSAEHGPNWNLAREKRPQRRKRPSMPNWPIVRRAEILDVNLELRSPVLEEPLNVEIDVLRHVRNENDFLDTVLDGRINTRAVSLQGRVGPYVNLLAGRDVTLELSGNLGELQMTGAGYINDFRTPQYSDLNLKLNATDIDQVTEMLGIVDLGSGAIEVEASLVPGEGQADGKIDAQFGEYRLTADGSFADRRDAAFTMAASGPDFGRMSALFGLPRIKREPFELSGGARFKGDDAIIEETVLLIGDTSLRVRGQLSKLPELENTELSMEISGDDFAEFKELFGRPIVLKGPYELTAQVKSSPDNKEFITAEIRVGDHVTVTSGELGDFPDFSAQRLEFKSAGPDVSEIADMFGVSGVPKLPYEATGTERLVDGAVLFSDLKLSLGPHSLQLDGDIDIANFDRDLDLGIRLSSPDLIALTGPIPLYDLPSDPFDLSAGLRKKGNLLHLENVRASLGDTDLRANATVDLGQEQGAKISVEAGGNNLAAILPEIPVYRAPDKAFEARGSLTLTPGLLRLEGVRVQVNESVVNGTGAITLPPEPLKAGFEIDGAGNNMGDIGRILEYRFPDSEFEFATSLYATKKLFALQEISVQSGKSDLRGEIQVELGGRPQVQMEIDAAVLDLKPIVEANRQPEADSESPATDGRLIPATQIPLASLDAADWLISVAVDESLGWETVGGSEAIQRRGSDTKLLAKIRNGALTIEEFSLASESGTLSGYLEVKPNNESGATVMFSAKARDFMLTEWTEVGDELKAAPPFDFDASIEGSGMNLRDLLATANGEIVLFGSNGWIKNGAFEILLSDFFNKLIAKLNPFAKQEEFTEIKCIALMLGVKNGNMEGEPALVVQTDKLNIFSNGEIDLRDESIDVAFDTKVRKRLGVSSGEFLTPYFKVGGTLADPKVRLDAEATVVGGGVAVATFGLSILLKSTWERIFVSEEPCKAALEEWRG